MQCGAHGDRWGVLTKSGGLGPRQRRCPKAIPNCLPQGRKAAGELLQGRGLHTGKVRQWQ